MHVLADFLGGLVCGIVVSMVFILSVVPLHVPSGPKFARRGITTVLTYVDEKIGWEAHVLELDLVTYGRSLNHAVAMAEEAATMMYEDNLSRGVPVRHAPAAEWAVTDDLRSYVPSTLNNVPVVEKRLVVDHVIGITYEKVDG